MLTPDQEFLASYAVDIDEQGVERLQSILEENRSLAESLSKAFQQAYADLDSFVREAIVSIPSLARFEEAQASAIDSAGKAEQAILALTSAYSGLTAAIPDESLNLTFPGLKDSSGVTQSSSAEMPRFLDALRTGESLLRLREIDNSSERNESGRKNSEFASWLSDISGSLNRLVMLSAGTDNVSDASGGSGRGTAGAGVMGESALSLNLAGTSEELQGFLEELASSEAEIPAGLNLAGADEDLAALQARAGETEAAMPLRLDRTRAEASLADLRRILMDPVRLSADTAGILSAASSALASIKNSFAGTTLTLKAAVMVSGEDGSENSGDSGSDAGAQGTSSGSDSPLANALRAAAGGRYTRPTKVEVAEDGDTEYIIPVDKEADAVPLLRQALADLSDSARETVLGSLSAEKDALWQEFEAGAAGDDRGDGSTGIPQGYTVGTVPPVHPRMPELSVPEIQIPELKIPEIRLPEISVPKIKMPEVNASELAPQGPDRGDSSGVRLDTSPDAQKPNPTQAALWPAPPVRTPDRAALEISFPEIVAPDIDLSALNALAGLPEMMAAAVAAASAPVSVSNVENKSVEAPVNINVTASGADPQILGQSIYDSAQRYLQKTLQSALV